MPRFHCPDEIPHGGIFRLPENVAHHALRVMRLAIGDEIVLFDGRGGESVCRIADARNVEILARKAVERESGLDIVLVQALSSSEKMDWIVQKAVELGARSIQAVETKRSTVRLSADRAKKREDHWRSVAISACEQCGRNGIPEILPLVSLESWLSIGRDGTKLLLSPSGRSLGGFPAPSGKIFLLVGPEGGLAPEEDALAASSGFLALGLGPRILRTETAGLAALSVLQALWGDFS